MKTWNKRSASIALLSVSVTLGGCIGSPLTGPSVAALYTWNDRDTPISTRASVNGGGPLDWGYLFEDILTEYPQLADKTDQPMLLEACDDDRCFSVVLFGEDFEIGDDGKVAGSAQMTPFSTLMYNAVDGLPAAEVRYALDELSGTLLVTGRADYAEFLSLDPLRVQDHSKLFRGAGLYDEAMALLAEQPGATVEDLLGSEPLSTEDLVVSPDFDFDSSFKLAVDADISQRATSTAYLLLCSRYQALSSGYVVDYSSCPLRAMLRGGAWQGDLNLSGTSDELLSVVLVVNDLQNPQYQLWRRAADGDSLSVR